MARHPDDRLTAADIEREYDATRAAVRQRMSRGQLRPVGRLGGRGGGPWLFARRHVDRVFAYRSSTCHTIASG